jgi:prepilin-type processing-associated H-X9-DG protein
MNDNDDKFPKSAAKVHDSIFPYTKNRKLWFCPEHPDMVAFTFNANLLGKTANQVAKPAETVMIYQGHDGKLEYDDEGKAAIAFADGHAKRYAKAQSAQLRWKP